LKRSRAALREIIHHGCSRLFFLSFFFHKKNDVHVLALAFSIHNKQLVDSRRRIPIATEVKVSQDLVKVSRKVPLEEKEIDDVYKEVKEIQRVMEPKSDRTNPRLYLALLVPPPLLSKRGKQFWV
jgi:hypothetical protein